MPDIFDEIAPDTSKKDIFDQIQISPLRKIASKVTDYFFPQWLTQAPMQRGQQNIFGDIFNRPGAAIRSAIQAPPGQRWQAYQKGANIPEEVPSFTEKIYLKQGIQPTGHTLMDFARAYPAAFSGTIADIATNPADILSILSGKKIGQAISQEAQKARPLLREALQKISPITETAQRGLQKAGNIAISKMPRIMGKDYTIQRANKAVQFLDDTRTNLGRTKGEAIKQYGNRVVDLTEFRKEIPFLPENVTNALSDPIYMIEKTEHGVVKPTVANLDRVREALGDFMTSAQWEEATTKSKQLIKRAYGILGNSIKRTVPEVKEPIESYHKFMQLYRDVNKTLRTTTGDILEKRLRGAFKPDAERGYQIAWEEMWKKYIPQLRQIAVDVQKFNQRQTMKKIMGRIIIGGGLVGAGYGIGKRLLGTRGY